MSDKPIASSLLRQEGPQQEWLIAFLRERRNIAEQARLSRVEAAAAWRDGTDEDHEQARQMAARQSGRPVARHNADEREDIAAVQDRIAVKNANEVRLFDAAIAALSDLAAAQAQIEVLEGSIDYLRYLIDHPVTQQERWALILPEGVSALEAKSLTTGRLLSDADCFQWVKAVDVAAHPVPPAEGEK